LVSTVTQEGGVQEGGEQKGGEQKGGEQKGGAGIYACGKMLFYPGFSLWGNFFLSDP
jgi:hypothetical protein